MFNFLKKLFSSNPQPTFKNIFAAKVLEVKKHPNADRLRVVKLDIGDRVIDPVVCGAWNFEAGDIVALALPGAYIPKNIHSETHEGFTLGTAKLRGVESQGMICAKFELGLGPIEEKPEIMILKSSTKAGSQFSQEMLK